MGNVPTKERARLALVSGSSGRPTTRTGRRHTTLALIGTSPLGSNSHLFGHKKHDDKQRLKEKHLQDLIVRVRDNVDGGYLAPHGVYKLNLDYNTDIVRSLIVARRLAPFYTPLQDWDLSWTPEEVVTLVLQTPLHALDNAFEDEEADDADDHKIHRLANFLRRQELKKRQQELEDRARELQRQCEVEYTACKRSHDPAVLSRELVMRLYGDASECPICFLYYPQNLNRSRCCRQPICTECFVQIRRLDPHPPHDAEEEPQTLISEPALCPYCAMANFGVTYDRPQDVCVGIGGKCAPGEYGKTKETIENTGSTTEGEGKTAEGETAEGETAEGKTIEGKSTDGETAEGTSTEREKTEGKSTEGNSHSRSNHDSAVVSDEEVGASATPSARRRSSMPADAAGVITTDYIRPDWEQKLASAKNKLARKAATASAIHALNLLLEDARPQYLVSLEDRMVEEAMRLLLLDEEERRRPR